MKTECVCLLAGAEPRPAMCCDSRGGEMIPGGAALNLTVKNKHTKPGTSLCKKVTTLIPHTFLTPSEYRVRTHAQVLHFLTCVSQ